MKQIWITQPGEPEVLQIRESDDPTPKPGQVRVRAMFCGINFADIIGRMGLYPDLPPMPCVPGYEVAGRIDAAGDGVDQTWLNREVAALTRFGGYSDVACVPLDQVFALPPGMSLEEGAALPVNYITAYQLIEVMGGLKKGDTVLIHSAGGGVGIAAIQLARHLGATIIGTASAAKHEYLKSIGVAHCVDYRTEDFESRVMDLTGGRGVELILDPIGGESTKKSFRLLAPSGRLGMYGVFSLASGPKRKITDLVKFGLNTPWFSFHPVRLMNENKGIFGVNLGHMWGETARLRRWAEALLEYYRQGVIRPKVDKIFPFAEAAQAQRYVQDRKNVGKVLLRP